MKELSSIDFLSDGSLQRRLVSWSFAILGLGFTLGVAVSFVTAFDFNAELDVIGRLGGWEGLIWGALLACMSLAALPVHELVHAAFFRLFGGAGTKVVFGWQSGMLYAGSPGLVLPRRQFVAVLTAPALLLSALLLAAPALLGLPMLGYVAFALHLSGCSGDLLAARAILRDPRCTHCEDTPNGVRLLG